MWIVLVVVGIAALAALGFVLYRRSPRFDYQPPAPPASAPTAHAPVAGFPPAGPATALTGSWLGPADEPLLSGMRREGPTGLGKLADDLYRELGGIESAETGIVEWRHPQAPLATLNRMLEMRATFRDPAKAREWIVRKAATLDGLPPLPRQAPVGDDCHATGGQTTTMDGKPLLLFGHVFRVGCTVVRLYGEGYAGLEMAGARFTHVRFREIAEKARPKVAAVAGPSAVIPLAPAPRPPGDAWISAEHLPPGLSLRGGVGQLAGLEQQLFDQMGGVRDGSGRKMWAGDPYGSPVSLFTDVRANFRDAASARAWMEKTLPLAAEGAPPIPNAPPVGDDCHVFGGNVELIPGSPTVIFVYTFRVGATIVRVCAMGDGQAAPDVRLTMPKVRALAELARHLVAQPGAAPASGPAVKWAAPPPEPPPPTEVGPGQIKCPDCGRVQGNFYKFCLGCSLELPKSGAR